MAKILVTGGSGFIGTHLIDKLAARGDDIANIDVAPPSKAAHAPYWKQMDLSDTAPVVALITAMQPDVIVNLAAIADILKGREAFRVNTVGLENLLAGAEQLEKKPRVVHASTQLVAGPGYEISGPRDYSPYTEYGVSKMESEEVLWNWQGETEWTIIRPTVVWGPIYPTFVTSTWYYIYKRWYLVPARDCAHKTFSYVGNLVDQFIAAGDAPGELVNRKMFYGGDETIDSAVWIDAFSKAFTGKPAPRMPNAILRLLAFGGDISARLGGPSPINSGRLYRMTQDYPTPLEDAHRVLGKGTITLDQGVAATVAWLREAYPERFGSA